jgi:PAS domain S-box-containing protein
MIELDPTPTGPISVTNPSEAKRVWRAYHNRRIRVLALSVSTLLLLGILFALGSLNLVPLLAPSTPSSTVALYGLSTVVFIATILLLALLIRNILKLRQERRRRTLGSKFQTRLVAASASIALLPVLMLFLFAYGLINRSLDKWFNLPAERVQRDADFIAASVMAREEQNLFDLASGLARRVEAGGGVRALSGNAELRREITHDAERLGLASLVVADAGGAAALEYGEKAAREAPELRAIRRPASATGEERRGHVRSADIVVYVGAPVREPAAKGELGAPAGAVFASRKIPGDLAAKVDELTENARERATLVSASRVIKVTYLSILFFVTLLLIFCTTWIASYVARGVTVPIQALAEGTQAVAKGNFDHYVSANAEDELAVLIDSFNEMARQLAASRMQLEDRRRYIETVLQSLFTGIVSLDEKGRLATINQAGVEMLGSRPEDVGRTFIECAPAANRADFQRVLRRTRRLGQTTLEVELRVSERKPMHVAVTGAALRTAQGHYAGAVLMIEDLSPLIQAQRSAVWSEVARRMAHEIKNPLTPIQLSAERIARNIRRHGADSERVRATVVECTDIIEREVCTLQRMVDEFSRFAKLPDARPQMCSLNDIVRNALALYAERLDGIVLEAHLSDETPPLNLDAEQIKRCLVNLIDNAMHAVQEEDGAAAGAKRIGVTTTYDAERDCVRLSVADTGVGIAAEDRDRLFEPYFSTRKRGTGLGLAIVGHIVADHHGVIRFEDNHPRGAVFIMELPVGEPAPSQPVADPTTAELESPSVVG